MYLKNSKIKCLRLQQILKKYLSNVYMQKS